MTSAAYVCAGLNALDVLNLDVDALVGVSKTSTASGPRTCGRSRSRLNVERLRLFKVLGGAFAAQREGADGGASTRLVKSAFGLRGRIEITGI